MIRKNEGVQQKIGKLNRKPGRLVDEVYLCDFRGKKKEESLLLRFTSVQKN